MSRFPLPMIMFCKILNTIHIIGILYGESVNIPDHLIHCYRGNETQPWIGNSMRLLIELIKKIEEQNPTSVDIRILSANIFHEY